MIIHFKSYLIISYRSSYVCVWQGVIFSVFVSLFFCCFCFNEVNWNGNPFGKLQINTHHLRAFFWFHWWFPRSFFALNSSYFVAYRNSLSPTDVVLMLTTALKLTAPNEPRHFDVIFAFASYWVTWRFEFDFFFQIWKIDLLIVQVHKISSNNNQTHTLTHMCTVFYINATKHESLC